MADFWGPDALTGEQGYRRERLSTVTNHHGHRTHRPGTLAVVARPDGSLRPVQPAHPLLSAARGWVLRGSGAWHVAR